MLEKLVCIAAFLTFHTSCTGQIVPLEHAHAHNDYKHKHPLNDALDNGFMSVEADIFLVHGKLIVSHVHPFFKKKKTLEKLYLDPLVERLKKNSGALYPTSDQPLLLLIDIKTDANETYKVLEQVLKKYETMLCLYDSLRKDAAILVVLSGNKPYDLVAKSQKRNVFIDQSLFNLKDHKSADLCPLTSTKYTNIIHWKGKGKIPAEEKQKLVELVTEAHAQGKRVRLWASPENEIVWKELLDDGVDLINTDKLEKLKAFLLQEKK